MTKANFFFLWAFYALALGFGTWVFGSGGFMVVFCILLIVGLALD